MDKEKLPVDMLQLSTGQVVLCRAKVVSDNPKTWVLDKPLVLAMTQNGMGFDHYPMFVDESVTSVEVKDEYVVTNVRPDHRIEQAYLKSIGEVVIETPKPASLILPA